jgi:hypothetical protein
MWPLATRAQDRAIPVVGFLSAASPSTFARFLEAFQQGLREQGFVEATWRLIIGGRTAICISSMPATELVADRVVLIDRDYGLPDALASAQYWPSP